MIADGVDVTGQIADLERVRRDLKRGIEAIKAKRPVIDLAWSYYDGDHPALWLTAKLQEVFGSRLASNLADNYCETAIDAVLDRLNVVGFADRVEPGTVEQESNASPLGIAPQSDLADVADDNANAPTLDVLAPVTDAMLAERVWADNDLDLEQEDLYRHATVAGEGYAIVWPSEDGSGYDVVVNDPRTVHVQYGSLRRTDVRWAVKVWHSEDDRRWRATVYYPDRVVRLVAPITTTPDDEPAAHTFTLDADDAGGAHGFGRVPVVPFNRRRNSPSRLRNLIPIQDKINKLAANKMVAAEFGAFRQRYVLSTQAFADGVLKNSPDHAWLLDPGTPDAPTKVGEFAVTELANYDLSTEAEVRKFFTIARLPKHMMSNPGTPPSGDAVRADEGPFVALCDAYVSRFGASWRDVFDLCGLNVEPVWGERESNGDLSTAQTVKTYTDAGAPLGVALRKYAGWNDAELGEVEAKQAADAERAEAAAAQAGVLAMQAFGAVGADTPNPLA